MEIREKIERDGYILREIAIDIAVEAKIEIEEETNLLGRAVLFGKRNKGCGKVGP